MMLCCCMLAFFWCQHVFFACMSLLVSMLCCLHANLPQAFYLAVSMITCCKHVILLQACYPAASMLSCCKHVIPLQACYSAANTFLLTAFSCDCLRLLFTCFLCLFLYFFLSSLVYSSLIYDFFFCMHCKVLMDNYSVILLLFGNHITNYFSIPLPFFYRDSTRDSGSHVVAMDDQRAKTDSTDWATGASPSNCVLHFSFVAIAMKKGLFFKGYLIWDKVILFLQQPRMTNDSQFFNLMLVVLLCTVRFKCVVTIMRSKNFIHFLFFYLYILVF